MSVKASGCRMRGRKTRFVEILRTTPPNTVCPNFYVLAHANGCRFSPLCSYCYLKSSFQFLKGPEAFDNVDTMLEEVAAWIARDGLESNVLNAGNLSDSLAFETVRPMMARLIELFRERARGRPHTLLLVTKGGRRECASLLSSDPCPNVVVSFSVNHPGAARRHEHGAAPVGDRLRTARDLKRRGWRVRMRLDPMIMGYDYGRSAQALRRLGPERVTLGALRADQGLMRLVKNDIFRELEPPREQKGLWRYTLEQRLALFRPVVEVLRGVCPMALCEEGVEVWESLGLDKDATPCNCRE